MWGTGKWLTLSGLRDSAFAEGEEVGCRENGASFLMLNSIILRHMKNVPLSNWWEHFWYHDLGKYPLKLRKTRVRHLSPIMSKTSYLAWAWTTFWVYGAFAERMWSSVSTSHGFQMWVSVSKSVLLRRSDSDDCFMRWYLITSWMSIWIFRIHLPFGPDFSVILTDLLHSLSRVKVLKESPNLAGSSGP